METGLSNAVKRLDAMQEVVKIVFTTQFHILNATMVVVVVRSIFSIPRSWTLIDK
jgi:hypothetical protein